MGKSGSKGGRIKSKFPEGKPTLVYWALCGRGDIAKCMMHAGNVEFDLDTENANAWPAFKDKAPFGQLPVLTHGDLTFAQGGAINRYLARLAGLYPDDPIDASKCDMIIEECMDVFGTMFKCKNAADKDAKKEQWTKVKDEVLPTHFGYLEKLLTKKYFGGDEPNAADVTFFAVYGVFVHAQCGAEEVMEKFPKLKAVVEGTKELGTLKEFERESHYFSADPENGAH